MKFSIYSSIANPPRGEHLDRCVDEVIEEAQAAEAYGFDGCFFGEHHQDKDGFLPSPLIVATAVAASTRTLNVGTSVILLPLHHPVKIAEDVITLDIVSKGRIILGVGLGYQGSDFAAFGVAPAQRVELFEEKLEIIRKCWTGEPFSYHGKTPRPGKRSGASPLLPKTFTPDMDRSQHSKGGPKGGETRRCSGGWAKYKPEQHDGTGQTIQECCFPKQEDNPRWS